MLSRKFYLNGAGCLEIPDWKIPVEPDLDNASEGNSSMNLASYRDRLAGIVGNFLEHYDNALFGLLSPFIAPLFFGGEDHITALILTYCMLPLGIITRPVSYTHLRAHETVLDLVCRLLLEKKK